MRFETSRIPSINEPQEAAWTPRSDEPRDEGGRSCEEIGCKWVDRRPRHQNAGENGDSAALFAADGNRYRRWGWLPDPGREHFHDVCVVDEEGEDVTPECAECEDNFPKYGIREHIAGPTCANDSGYNGNNISNEEMRACNAVQFLVQKSGAFLPHDYEDFKPEPDDEEFERTTHYFLTGLGESIGEVEQGHCPVWPVRHGVDDAGCAAEYDGFCDGHMPFHPYCLEAYKRVSQLRRQKIDMLGLARWFDAEASAFPRHPAVRRGADQWWEHWGGDEFLAANPIYVPALPAIIDASKRLQPGFNLHDSPFLESEIQPIGEEDCFGKLPEELRHLVLESLGSKDIANLRLVSRAFRHLPNWLWHDLMKKEMPWFWEAWSDMPYSFWACTTQKEIKDQDKAFKNRRRQIDKSLDLSPEEKKRQKRSVRREQARSRQPRPVERLERAQTDWHFLYRQIKRDWKNLKGLENRERIWITLEYIVRRVDKPDEGRTEALEEHAERYPSWE
ncbi:hypothetical protein Q7P37_007268 [Cladosporium fusiforme]